MYSTVGTPAAAQERQAGHALDHTIYREERMARSHRRSLGPGSKTWCGRAPSADGGFRLIVCSTREFLRESSAMSIAPDRQIEGSSPAAEGHEVRGPGAKQRSNKSRLLTRGRRPEDEEKMPVAGSSDQLSALGPPRGQ